MTEQHPDITPMKKNEADDPKLVISLSWLGRILSRLSKINPFGTFFVFRQKIIYKDGSRRETEIKLGPNIKDEKQEDTRIS